MNEETATGVSIMRDSMMTRFQAILYHLKQTAMNDEEREQLKWVESAVSSEPQMITQSLELVQRLLDSRIQGYVRHAVTLGEIRGFLQR